MIKIEVTGQSIAEVADKLLALGLNLSNVSLVDPAESIAPEAKEIEKPAESITPDVGGKAAETPSAPAEPAATTSAPAAPSDAPIDADALKTLVLSVVKTKGRDTMVAILEQFVVAKATDVPAELLGELVAALKAALA